MCRMKQKFLEPGQGRVNSQSSGKSVDFRPFSPSSRLPEPVAYLSIQVNSFGILNLQSLCFAEAINPPALINPC